MRRAWLVVYAVILAVALGSICAINQPRRSIVLGVLSSSSLPLYDGSTARAIGIRSASEYAGRYPSRRPQGRASTIHPQRALVTLAGDSTHAPQREVVCVL